MKSKKLPAILIIVVSVSVLVSMAIAAQQDKYTLRVPGGLAFSEFKGYEGWQAVSLSQN